MSSKKKQTLINLRQYEPYLVELVEALSNKEHDERDKASINNQLRYYSRVLNIPVKVIKLYVNDLVYYREIFRGKSLSWDKIEALPVKVILSRPSATSGKVSESITKNHDEWLTRCSVFIPKRFREAWLGDLLEDRMEMRSHDEARLMIELATASQLLHIALANPKLWIISLGVWFLSKVRNWFA